uniref:Uncharacterized protein TCIL3000_10_840 n=1 Tax=Trypanosoma congolense (strain IL3000) TaxID=1068625 RepID=G0UVB0_TRYCI|nr:unnamed protein product [Trypanosoma congolense IL3000]
MAIIGPHRRFVAVELPFLLPTTVTNVISSHPPSQYDTLQEEDRRMIERFVPPAFLSSCMDDTTPQGGEKVVQQEGLLTNTESKEKLGIAVESEYKTGEVFSGWRPLDFDEGLEAEDTQVNDTGTGRRLATLLGDEQNAERERIRRESFPTFVPQILLQGFYRNDLLLEVRKRRRVKRVRENATGRVVEETLLSDGNECGEAQGTVIGVISRDVSIVRPADFCFSPFTSENVSSMPDLCSGNIFPPVHFLSEKALIEVTPGAGPPAMSSTSGAVDQADDDLFTDTTAPLWEYEGIPTLAVMADDPNIPPLMSPLQEETLRRLNTGCGAEGCVEVQKVRMLLDERPVWTAKDLLDAIFQSGLCPRTHYNKKAVACLTYIIKNGPFNRMRIRLGFNPYACHTSAALQRIALKISRRSELGTLLRDISRVPHIGEVLRGILRTKAEQRNSEQATTRSQSLPYIPRGTLAERIAKGIEDGQLYLAFQVIDVSDSTVFRDLLAAVKPDAVVPLQNRSLYCGWFSSGSYQRAVNYVLGAMVSFIRDEVEPALLRVKGTGEVKPEEEEQAGGPSPCASSASTSRSASYGNGDDADPLESTSSVTTSPPQEN